MTDEEKKAIDDLFALTHINGYIDLYMQREVKIRTLDLSKWQNGVKVLLNLIEKQSKEIEILNKNMNLLREQNISYKQSIHGLKEINKKGKDKIEELKEKNKEYENMIINHKKQLKQSGIYGYDYDLKILKE